METTGPRAVLVGPPGAGKTTVGTLLSQRWSVPLRDTDTDVQHRFGRTVAEIFSELGEETFRTAEAEAVAEAVRTHPGVLALGGGAVLREQTRAALQRLPVVYLSVGLSEGVRRTGLSSARPLLRGLTPRATFSSLLEARIPVYRQLARIEVPTDELTPHQVVDRIAAELANSELANTGGDDADPGDADTGDAGSAAHSTGEQR